MRRRTAHSARAVLRRDATRRTSSTKANIPLVPIWRCERAWVAVVVHVIMHGWRWIGGRQHKLSARALKPKSQGAKPTTQRNITSQLFPGSVARRNRNCAGLNQHGNQLAHLHACNRVRRRALHAQQHALEQLLQHLGSDLLLREVANPHLQRRTNTRDSNNNASSQASSTHVDTRTHACARTHTHTRQNAKNSKQTQTGGASTAALPSAPVRSTSHLALLFWVEAWASWVARQWLEWSQQCTVYGRLTD